MVNLSVLRTGATLFPISPRNSAPAVAHLLETTGVTAILVGGEPSLNRLAAAAFSIIRNAGGTPPSAALIPTFDDIFSTRSATVIDTDEFLPPLGWRRHDRAGLIVHSSGLSPATTEFVLDRLTASPIQVQPNGPNRCTGLTTDSPLWQRSPVSFPSFDLSARAPKNLHPGIRRLRRTGFLWLAVFISLRADVSWAGRDSCLVACT